ncbi:MAG: deacetylase [Clostridiales bacterium]|nr:deacetylase [Clostridiales bacterium]
MFYIVNKERIVSCVIALSTILILFLMATVVPAKEPNTVTTSTKEKRLLPIYSVDTEESKVALTINCAWSAEDVDLILETLNNNQVKCTFFMVGEWVGKNQEAVKKIFDNGHEIANHSYSHPHVNNLSYDKNVEEINKCNNLIEKVTGQRPTLYRGPYGEYNDTVIQAATDANNKTIQWSIDSLDWQGLTGEQMWARISEKLENGSIILMHNGTENTALSLDMLIKNIKGKGYKLVTVSDLIYQEDYSIDNNGVQQKN